MSFLVSDKQVVTTIDNTEGCSNVQSLWISDDATYLNHFKNIFEGLCSLSPSGRSRGSTVRFVDKSVQFSQSPVCLLQPSCQHLSGSFSPLSIYFVLATISPFFFVIGKFFLDYAAYFKLLSSTNFGNKYCLSYYKCYHCNQILLVFGSLLIFCLQQMNVTLLS